MFRCDYNFVDNTEPSGNVIPIDGYDGQDFNKNEAGWIRNDISQLARAQSLQEYNLIMSRLQILKASDSIPDNVSVDDVFKSIRPRFCQSPNEIEQWIEFTQADVDSAIAEVLAKKEANFDEKVSEVVSQSASE